MISQFLEEEQVNMVAAVLAVIFVVISIILGVAGRFMFAAGELTGALASWGGSCSLWPYWTHPPGHSPISVVSSN